MKKHLLYLLLASLFVGCAQEITTEVPETGETFTPDELKFLSTVGKENRLDAVEVDRIVGDVTALLDETAPSTRSAVRTVSKVTPIYVGVDGVTTNSDGQSGDELFCAVEFGEDEGFALISVDHRLPDEVLIIVGHGNFPEAENDNPGFALMMAGAGEYARREIGEYERWADSVEIALQKRPFDPDANNAPISTRTQIEPTYEERVSSVSHTTYGPWTTSSRISPMIPVEWGQKGVFNDTAEENEGGDVFAGCVAIATVQLMAYWQHPTSYHGIDIDWDELCNWTGVRSDLIGGYKTWSGRMGWAPQSTQDMCADIIWHIGGDVDMDFGTDVSLAPSRKAINLLQDYGYSAPSRQNYAYSPVLESLNNSRPVYMHGSTGQILGIFPGGDGHAWLIDGHLKQERTVTVETTYFREVLDANDNVIRSYTTTSRSTSAGYREFFHNNFGWEGGNNGYYVCGIFDASEGNGPELPSDTRGEEHNYQYNLRVWTNIYHL